MSTKSWDTMEPRELPAERRWACSCGREGPVLGNRGVCPCGTEIRVDTEGKPLCEHAWMVTGGAGGFLDVEVFERCAKCGAEQETITPHPDALERARQRIEELESERDELRTALDIAMEHAKRPPGLEVVDRLKGAAMLDSFARHTCDAQVALYEHNGDTAAAAFRRDDATAARRVARWLRLV